MFMPAWSVESTSKVEGGGAGPIAMLWEITIEYG
jgi:hypothetical protein